MDELVKNLNYSGKIILKKSDLWWYDIMKLKFLRYDKTMNLDEIMDAGFSKVEFDRLPSGGLKLKVANLLFIYKVNLYVAYSPEENKVVGTILLKRITDINFRWYIWTTQEHWVGSQYRRQGIMTFLHAQIADLLRKKGEDRFYVFVNSDNMDPYNYFKKGKSDFQEISKMFYLTGPIPAKHDSDNNPSQENIWIRDYNKDNYKKLYEIFSSCFKKDYHNYGVTDKNFLVPSKITSKILIHFLKITKQYYKKIIVLGKEDKIMGYATITSAPFLKNRVKVVEVYMKDDENCFLLMEILLRRCFDILRARGEKVASCNIWSKSIEQSKLEKIAENLSMRLKWKYIFEHLI